MNYYKFLDTEIDTETQQVFDDIKINIGCSLRKVHPTNKDKIEMLDKKKFSKFVRVKFQDKFTLASLLAAEEKIKTVKNPLFIFIKYDTQPLGNILKEKKIFSCLTTWVGGLLTNYKILRENVIVFFELLQKEKNSIKLSIKEKKQLKIYKNKFDGLLTTFSECQPDLIVVSDSILGRKIVFKEALKTNIPIMSICNPMCDITNISFPIFANDFSQITLEYIMNRLIHSFNINKKDE